MQQEAGRREREKEGRRRRGGRKKKTGTRSSLSPLKKKENGARAQKLLVLAVVFLSFRKCIAKRSTRTPFKNLTETRLGKPGEEQGRTCLGRSERLRPPSSFSRSPFLRRLPTSYRSERVEQRGCLLQGMHGDCKRYKWSVVRGASQRQGINRAVLYSTTRRRIPSMHPDGYFAQNQRASRLNDGKETHLAKEALRDLELIAVRILGRELEVVCVGAKFQRRSCELKGDRTYSGRRGST